MDPNSPRKQSDNSLSDHDVGGGNSGDNDCPNENRDDSDTGPEMITPWKITDIEVLMSDLCNHREERAIPERLAPPQDGGQDSGRDGGRGGIYNGICIANLR
jgi:hypothetical protein